MNQALLGSCEQGMAESPQNLPNEKPISLPTLGATAIWCLQLVFGVSCFHVFVEGLEKGRWRRVSNHAGALPPVAQPRCFSSPGLLLT